MVADSRGNGAGEVGGSGGHRRADVSEVIEARGHPGRKSHESRASGREQCRRPVFFFFFIFSSFSPASLAFLCRLPSSATPRPYPLSLSIRAPFIDSSPFSSRSPPRFEFSRSARALAGTCIRFVGGTRPGNPVRGAGSVDSIRTNVIYDAASLRCDLSMDEPR